jgi:PAS domain S-box-containing protein
VEPETKPKVPLNVGTALQLLATSPDCVKVLNLDGQITFVTDAGLEQLGIPHLSLIADRKWVDFWPETSWPKIQAAIDAALAGRISRFSGFAPTLNGTPKWWDVVVSPIRDGDQKIESILAVSRDVTERHNADVTRELLVAELHHRVKNTLGIVQSIANQTARHSRDTSQFLTTFHDRLQALASAHTVLTEASWAGAMLGDVVRYQLANVRAEYRNIDIDGPDVLLPSQAALQISLVLHELASNAYRHGALAQPNGRVAIWWRVEAGQPRRLVLTWQESGGLPVVPMTTKGFGMALIERTGNLPHLQVKVSFIETGVICSIEADLPDDVPRQTLLFDPAPGRH